MDVEARMEFGGTAWSDSQSLSVQYRTRLFRRGNLYVSGMIHKRGSSSGAAKNFRATYNVNFRKLTLSSTYTLFIDTAGNQTHRMMLNVSRTFGRSFRRLW
jgi:outer membrane usher protein FimD/PapC